MAFPLPWLEIRAEVLEYMDGLMASFKGQLDQESRHLETLGHMFSFSGAV